MRRYELHHDKNCFTRSDGKSAQSCTCEGYDIYDGNRRVAYCLYRRDAEEIVEALNAKAKH